MLQTSHKQWSRNLSVQFVQALESSHEAPSSIINRELAQSLPSEFRGYFPRETNVKRTIQRQRNKRVPSLPKCVGDVSITGQRTKTVDGEEWLICNKTKCF